LNILFPEFFKNGEKNMTESVCFDCHSRVHEIIPASMLTPDKYIIIHKRMLLGEVIDNDLIRTWKRESHLEIEKRQARFSAI